MGNASSDRSGATLIDLSLHKITQRYGDLTILDGLSLDVQKGELCCLLGPSGCGKTTTLRIVAGFLQPEAGTVHLAGQEITRQPPQVRNVGMVFQNYALFPHLDVFDNLAYGLRRRRRLKDEIGTRVSDMLNLVQLDGYESRQIGELSGGQQQRVALARALVIEPRLLLLDEPLSNLDARLRTNMRDEIRRIQHTLGITTIYVTHDQEEAMSLADRVIIMREGRIEQIGAPREIYERPINRFVADFIGRVNLLPGRVIDDGLVLLGELYPLPQQKRAKGNVLCAIRPERIRMTKAPSSLQGIVQGSSYMGAMVQYRITSLLDEGTVLDVKVPSPEAIYQPGDRIGLEIREQDVLILEQRSP